MKNATQKKSSAIEDIRELLNQNLPLEALKFIDHLGQKTSELENARGVCLMRAGKINEAVAALRENVFMGHICIPSDAPVLYKINFATAMILANNKSAAFSILAQLNKNEHPYISMLKESVNQWLKSLNILERLSYHFGFYSNKPINLDFQPGEI